MTRLRVGSEIHPRRRDLWTKFYYQCPVCDGYCGCHDGTKEPLGFPAGPELRRARRFVHELLDPIWMRAWALYTSGHEPKARKAITAKARTRVYDWLAHQLGKPRDEMHIAMLTLEECRAAYRLLRSAEYRTIRDWAKSRKD